MCGAFESIFIKEALLQSFNKVTLVASILSVLIVLGMNSSLFAAENKKELINCDIQNQSCVQSISGGRVTFNIGPKPVKAMEDLLFEVRVKDLDLTGPPLIDLKMPGMRMGKNQVKTKMTDKDVYQGTGIIVRCPSGKTVWQAVVNLPGIGKLNFIFDVVY